MLKGYLKELKDNGFKYKLNKISGLYEVYKYGEKIVLIL